MSSIRRRLLLAAAGVLAVFVLATGLALGRAFVTAATPAEQEKLQGLVYALLGAVNIGPQAVTVDMPLLADPRLQQPGSGLYAMILNGRGEVVWRSPSVLEPPPPGALPAPGQWSFQRVALGHEALFRLAFGVRWTAAGGGRYAFVVFEDAHNYRQQLAGYRHALWSWLGGAAALLLLTLLGVLQWGLRPLGRVSEALRRIERGEAECLEGDHPVELRPLVDGLNALLARERARRERTRHALDNLAHSLKTPLAVLRGLGPEDGLGPPAAATVTEQVARMDQIVAFQLQRAAGARTPGLLPPLAVAPAVSRVAAAIERVYAGKGVRIRAAIPETLTARMDENQLMELAGNLLDNAAKWARVRVRVSAQRKAGGGVLLRVEDDGPGMDEADAARLLARGARADTLHPGQGIGLAVVAQIAADYGGRVDIGRSELGGAQVEVHLRTA